MSSNKIYSQRTKGGQQGDVFTLPVVVSFMLDEVGYTADADLSNISIFEPSCGEGEFVVEIVSRLYESSIKNNFDFLSAFKKNVFASEIDGEKMNVCIDRLQKKFHLPKTAFNNFFVEDFLLSRHAMVDIIVGNPPYIRYEEIPTKLLSVYKDLFQCFYYRADMYILFYEKSLLMLSNSGKLCFISPNRWLKNTYGKKLRIMIENSFKLMEIVDLEDADAFQEKVIAYPSIALISNQRPENVVKYSKIDTIAQLGHKKSTLLSMNGEDGDWTTMFSKEDYPNLVTIEEQGFKIGIGVATGNDSVYVSSQFKGILEDQVLLPCINAQNLKGNTMKWDGRYLLNPYDENGKLIDLSLYPKTKNYLTNHFEELAKRHKAKKNPNKWYATIDKVDINLKTRPKVLLPDISGNRYIFVDDGKFYPQHNIYYIVGGDLRELKLLAALLMSKQIRQQLDKIANHMNGGYARWQSQYLKRLRLPVIKYISSEYGNLLLNAYNHKDYTRIDEIASLIIDSQNKESIGHKANVKARQLTLNFEYA